MLDMIGQLEQQRPAPIVGRQSATSATRCASFAGYGKLSGKSLEDLRAGERVDVAAGKQDPLDFVLWKRAKDGEPAEAKWDSPWGRGRPGLAHRVLGDELATARPSISTSTAAARTCSFRTTRTRSPSPRARTAGTFVNYWMHNGFVRVDDEKMSKSLGNFFTIREVLKKYDAEVVRFFILRAHYRSPLNYSDAHLDDAPPGADAALHGAEGRRRRSAASTGTRPMPRASRRRWTTTSTRRKPWPCCSISPPN